MSSIFDHPQLRYLAFDTETVGLDPFKNEDGHYFGGVCEISVRQIDPETLETIEHWHTTLNPQGPISASASGVHGIRNRDVEDKPTLTDYLDSLGIDFWHPDLPPCALIAHNSNFDMKFIRGYVGCEYVEVDTLALARRYYPDAENHKLTTLAIELDFEDFSAKDAHGAAQDTLMLLELVKRLCRDTGLSLRELSLDAQRKEPITKMPFGKYRGRLISEIVKENAQYVDWCLREMKNLQPDLREALEAARGR